MDPISNAILEAILTLAVQKDALKYPTDKLDISIAYLRRVHFVTFYGAKRYRDEAHMLSMAPSVGTVRNYFLLRMYRRDCIFRDSRAKFHYLCMAGEVNLYYVVRLCQQCIAPSPTYPLRTALLSLQLRHLPLIHLS